MFIADDDYKSVTNLTIFAPSFAHIWQISTAVLLLPYFSSYLAAIGCHRAAIKKFTLSRISGNVVPKVEKIARLEITR